MDEKIEIKSKSQARRIESQLNIEWDEERVKEIESFYFSNTKNVWKINTPQGRYWVDDMYYLLSLLKKERVEKEEWSEIVAVHIHREHELEARVKELIEGIEKYLEKVVHSDGGYWECQKELKKLVEKE